MKAKIELKNAFWKPGDEKGILELFEKVFGKPMESKGSSLKHWQWEFIERPEKDTAIRLAWDEDRLVGQYAAGPVRLSVDGKEYLAALSYDTMTDPEYQGRGIFTTLANQLFSDLTEKGHHSIFGFPNGNSIYGFVKKLEWTRIGAPPIFVRPVSPANVLREKLKFSPRLAEWIGALTARLLMLPDRLLFGKAAKQFEIREESQFGDWADTLWERCKNQHRVWVVRNKEYLNWRYVDKPFSNYRIFSAWKDGQIAGYTVICREKKHAGTSTFIMDMLVDQACLSAGHALLHQVVSTAVSQQDTLVCAMVSPLSPMRRVFRQRGFFRLPEKLFPQELHFAGRLLCDEAGSDFFYESSSWGLSWGDDDVL